MKKLVSLTVTLALAATPFIALVNRQAIFDWWRLRDYSPSSRIVELAESTTMTDNGRHLFYVYHPDLQDKTSFNQSCDFNEHSIVLGCYVSGRGIYIYDVTDPRLDGIHEVTAAHEVLHVAYERLSSNEKKRIDKLTLDVYDNIQNQRIKDSVESYRKRDPSVVANELHSILATEIKELPAELEEHYARYFSDRRVIVNYSEQYEQAFSERKNRARELAEQIESTKQQFTTLEQSLVASRQQLNQEYQALENQRSSAEPTSFNARVRAYNALVQKYNADVQRSYALIERHNALVAEYNQVVIEEKELIDAIDSRPETIEQE